MTYISKPKVPHPGLKKNKLGLTARDYEGVISTLCAGCGHDSITAALVRAFFELEIPPHRVAKTSGIGCSSKTPAYFLRQAHGFNSTHGRMPSITTGANAANRSLYYVGVSGDGDSLSIGMGQFCHAIRRNVNMTYIVENNGVYGLTKGQFSASADVGSKTKKGASNLFEPIDPVLVALNLGATFVARGFSGDKEQLVPLLKAAILHHGFSMIDVISPCVTFNNHEGSTKSYGYTRAHIHKTTFPDFAPEKSEITAKQKAGEVVPVKMHDGSTIKLKKVDPTYDPRDVEKAIFYVREHQARQEVVTGLLYINEDSQDLHEMSGSSETPLVDLSYEDLCPGAKVLDEIQSAFT